MRKRLLVTDLDNTLYDWVTFFSESFGAMARELSCITGIREEQLLAEFKMVHQRYKNSEQPFAILELPSVRSHFGTSCRSELLVSVDSALYAFNRERKKFLKLYQTVFETLQLLHDSGVVIVGHTEAMVWNSYWRLSALSISKFFLRLYTLEGKADIHPDPTKIKMAQPPEQLVRIVPQEKRKPNPMLLVDICQREGYEPSDVVYVGDSLIRDVSMAKKAGVFAVWARYGTKFDRSTWDLLVKVTHWTDEDVERERSLEKNVGYVDPDLTINEFRELLGVFIR